MKRPFGLTTHAARTSVRLFFVAIALLVFTLLVIQFLPEKIAPIRTQTITPTPTPPSPAGSIAIRSLPKENLSPEPCHPLAVSFGADPALAQREAEILLEILTFYRKEFGTFPAGQENADIMRALTGNNPRRLPIFPREHSRMDASGNLLDAWGKPFVFHPISSQYLEVRSCGPDGEIFTADDIRVPPPR